MGIFNGANNKKNPSDILKNDNEPSLGCMIDDSISQATVTDSENLNDPAANIVNTLPIVDDQHIVTDESDSSEVLNPKAAPVKDELTCDHSTVPEIIKNSYLYELDD